MHASSSIAASIAACLLSLLVLTACGGDDTAPADSGTTADSSAMPDGSSSDSSVATDSAPPADSGTADGSTPGSNIQTVFIVVMENHNWSDISGSSSAPYINSLLDEGAHSENYFNAPGVHPSEPNYIWMEAGTDFGIDDDANPDANHQPADTPHLVTMLEDAGVTWRSYQEGITGDDCPLSGRGLYAPKHNPMIYFDDVTDGNSTTATRCIEHVRPYSELADDLAAGTAAQYNFVTPDLCHDMHNSSGCDSSDSVKNGDDWLAAELPAMIDYVNAHDGVVFVTWDESEGGDHPIGMIALGPFARVGFTESTTHYTHGSLLRSVQEIFAVTPYLNDAADQESLANLFTAFP